MFVAPGWSQAQFECWLIEMANVPHPTHKESTLYFSHLLNFGRVMIAMHFEIWLA